MEIYLFTEANVVDVFEKILSQNQELKDNYLEEILEIKNDDKLLDHGLHLYLIGKKIVEMKLKNQSEDFTVLFANIEYVLNNSDKYITELIFRCLFGGIKLYGRNEFDFNTTFSKFINSKILEEYDEWSDFRVQSKPLKLIRRK